MLRAILSLLPELASAASALAKPQATATVASMVGQAARQASAKQPSAPALPRLTGTRLYAAQSAVIEASGSIPKPTLSDFVYSGRGNEDFQRRQHVNQQNRLQREYWMALGKAAGHGRALSPIPAPAGYAPVLPQAASGGTAAAAAAGNSSIFLPGPPAAGNRVVSPTPAGGGAGRPPAKPPSPALSPGGGGMMRMLALAGGRIPTVAAIMAVSALVSTIASQGIPLIAAMRSFGERVVNANRHLARWNGNLAASFARLDIRKMQGEMAEGAETQGTATMLNDQLGSLLEEFRPIKSMLGSLMNTLAIGAVVAARIGTSVAKIATLIPFGIAIMEMIEKNTKQGGPNDPINDFLNALKVAGGNPVRPNPQPIRPRAPIPPIVP